MREVRRLAPLLVFGALVMALSPSGARAVLLSSSGNNCSYVGVANYAIDYANKNNHLPLVGNCTNGSAKDSAWQAYKTCPSGTVPGVGRECWGSACNISTSAGKCASGNSDSYAPSCSDVSGNAISPGAQSWISLPSIRKGGLQYYAYNHKSDGQGYCDFQIGQSQFRLSFEHFDGGNRFNVSLQTPSQYGGGTDSWTSTALDDSARPPPTDGSGDIGGTYCPGYGFSRGKLVGPMPSVQATNSQWAWGYPGSSESNNSTNAICNENFIVSLTADPHVSSGAALMVINNPYGLQLGLQQAPPPSLATSRMSPSGARRLTNRMVGSDRWMATLDETSRSLAGVVIDGTGSGTAEIVSCHRKNDDGHPDPFFRQTEYECGFRPVSGGAITTRTISLPGSLFHLPSFSGDSPPAGDPADPNIGRVLLEALKRMQSEAALSRPREAGPTIRYVSFDELHLVAVKNDITKSLDLVVHYDRATTPTFISCEETGGSASELHYSCRTNARCTTANCGTDGWSSPVEAQFDRDSLAADESADALSVRKFSARASRVGHSDAQGSLRINAEFDAATLLPLGLTKASRLKLVALLRDGDGTELVSTLGQPILGESLPATRGTKPDRGTFKSEGRNSTSVRAAIVGRDEKIKLTVKIGKASIAAPAACQAGAGMALLTTAIKLEGGTPGSADRELLTTQPWRCLPSADGGFDLRADNRPKRPQNGSSGSSNRRPQAKIDVDNLTRARDVPNWFRLGAERSSDRDGQIQSFTFGVTPRERSGELAPSVAPSTGSTAHVSLPPGSYEISLTVTDDQGAEDTTQHRVSVKGLLPSDAQPPAIVWGTSADAGLGPSP